MATTNGYDLRERPWTNADTKAFGTRPAGAPVPMGETLRNAAAPARSAYADMVGRTQHFGPQPARTPLTFRGAASGAARGLGGALAVAPQVLDAGVNAAAVGREHGALSNEMGTQVAEDTAKIAATGAGAAMGGKIGMALGSFGGPLAPVTVPLGGMVGAGLGGWAGGGGAERAIHGLRGMFGSTPESPAQQIQARQEDVLNAPAVSTGAPNPTDQRLAAGAQTPPGVSAPGGAQGSLPAPTNNVTRVGNSYSGGNIAGDITINGQAPGGGAISPQNMAAADALAQRDSLRSAGAVMAGQGGGQGFPAAPRVQHSGNNWQAENNLRNLRVSASSITNDGGRFDRHRGVSPAALAYIDAQRADTVRRGAQPGLDMETIKTNNSLRGQMFDAQSRADAARYASDNSLRGDIYRTDGAERAARMSAAAAAQKQASDDAIRQNDLDIKNTDRTRQRFSVFDKEGKLDEAATNQALLAMDKIAPGFSRMSEDARGKSLPHADALFNLYNRTRQGRELGLGQAVFGNSNPPADSMPDFKGGRLKRQGLTGVLPGQAGKDGYFIEMPDGREISLGRGLSETELGLLRRNMQTGTWKD